MLRQRALGSFWRRIATLLVAVGALGGLLATQPALAEGGDRVRVCLSRTTAANCDVYYVDSTTTSGNLVEEAVTGVWGPWGPAFTRTVYGSGTYPGENGGTASVSYAVSPFFFFWYFGKIHVSDPSAGGSVTINLFFASPTAPAPDYLTQLCGYVGNWFLPDPNRMYGCVSVRDLD